MKQTMHAVLLTGHGGYEALDYRTDVPVPQPKAGEGLVHRAGVRRGETVLVTGASGGVGSAAVQLARRRAPPSSRRPAPTRPIR